MSQQKDVETLILDSGLFDAEWYIETYPDVANSGLEPLEHYLKLGSLLKRDPGIGFSSRRYLEANADVASAGLDPLQHYLRSLERGEKARQAFPSYARLPDNVQVTEHKMKERLETLEIENELLMLELNKTKAELEHIKRQP